MTLRSDLAQHIRDTVGDGIAVYDSGVDVLKTPAVVINPADPYQVPTTMGADARIQTFLNLYVVSNRTSPPDALNQLEDLRKQVATAVKTFNPRGRWVSFGSMGTTNVGGQPFATGVLQCIFVSEDT